MTKESYKRFFKTLANDNRLQIIHLLQENGPSNVTDIVNGTGLEQTLVSHNLKRLHECRFVEVKQNGKERVYSLNTKTILPLLKQLDKHVTNYCAKCGEKNHE